MEALAELLKLLSFMVQIFLSISVFFTATLITLLDDKILAGVSGRIGDHPGRGICMITISFIIFNTKMEATRVTEVSSIICQLSQMMTLFRYLEALPEHLGVVPSMPSSLLHLQAIPMVAQRAQVSSSSLCRI